MAFYDPNIFDVHVLLVDHDMNALFETTGLLQFNSYRVTPVGDASVASSILLSSQGNASFHLVMVDLNTSNPLGFKLMHEAIAMDLPVIVMATTATPALVKCAIEDGAFLFMQKPTSSDELKYIWQHIWRETTRKNKEKMKSWGETSTDNHNNRRSRSMHGDKMVRNVATSKGRLGEIISFGSESCDNDDGAVGEGSGMKPKLCTEWTPELHEKFMAAVKQLGEGRCFPKDILDLMNVPGLKRMQVASHLQKCRHGWQPNSNGRQGRKTNTLKPTRSVTKRFGAFPRGSQPQLPPNDGGLLVPASNSSTENVVGIEALEFGGGEDGLGLGLGLVGNSFSGNAFDYDFSLTDQNSDVGGGAIVDANFWNSWLADISREA